MILDANVLIAALDPTEALHRRTAELLTTHAGTPFHTPELTLAECLVAPARAGIEAVALGRLRSIGVETVTLDDVAMDLARIRASTGLRMPDAIVLLASERTGEPLGTFDTRLAAAARTRGLQVLG